MLKSYMDTKPTGQSASTFKSIGRWVVPGERTIVSIFDAENFSELEATWMEMSKFMESGTLSPLVTLDDWVTLF